MRFEPYIIGFCCNECAYAAADLAGMSQMRYPPNVRIIRVPCSGQVDPLYILRALELGADGVFVAGCLKGDCHYVDGNLKAEAMVSFLKRVLDRIGLGEDRLEMYFMASSDAQAFVDAAREFTERIRSLGPSPLRGKEVGKLSLGKKRTVIAEILGFIARSLGRDPDSLGVLEETPIAFSEIEVDQDRCTGCGACETSCPYDSIRIEDSDQTRLIGYSSSECTICGKCIENCPEKAISLSKRLDLSSFVSKRFRYVAKRPLARCELCGRFFAPEGILGKIEKLAPSTTLRYCPDCRKEMVGRNLARLVTS